jgi:epoxyqueuosine reductase QueG
MKESIRNFVVGLGVDDVGFASLQSYQSPNSPPIESLFPGARSMMVMAFRESSACDSPSPQLAMNARLDLMEFARSICYRAVRHLETTYDSRAVSVPVSYPMDFGPGKSGLGEVSLRHAAVAAGLGAFGLHNLVVHPRFGSRIIFSAVLTTLPLQSDPPVADHPCTRCGLCVPACPVGALNDSGKTHLGKCLKNSQPHGMGASVAFWSRFGESDPEQQKAMLRSSEYLALYQAGFIGYQYFCFRCLAACPVGVRPAGQGEQR